MSFTQPGVVKQLWAEQTACAGPACCCIAENTTLYKERRRRIWSTFGNGGTLAGGGGGGFVGLPRRGVWTFVRPRRALLRPARCLAAPHTHRFDGATALRRRARATRKSGGSQTPPPVARAATPPHARGVTNTLHVEQAEKRLSSRYRCLVRAQSRAADASSSFVSWTSSFSSPFSSVSSSQSSTGTLYQSNSLKSMRPSGSNL